MPDTNGFTEYKRLFLAEFKRLNDKVDRIDDEIQIIKKDLIILSVKDKIHSGFWGGLAGIVSAVAVGIIVHLLRQ